MSMNLFWNRCRRHRQSLCLLAADALPEAQRIELEQHLAACADCRSRYAQVESVTESFAAYRGSVASLEPSPAARQNWALAIRKASQSQPSAQGKPKPSLALWWRELIWPCRRTWGGIAALWLLMWAANWERPGLRDAAGSSSVATSAMTQSFEEERRLLAELIPPADPEPAEAPRRKPSPRSEIQKPQVIA